jgi:hypothetical protein
MYILFAFSKTGKMWPDVMEQEEVEENIWTSEGGRGGEGRDKNCTKSGCVKCCVRHAECC